MLAGLRLCTGIVLLCGAGLLLPRLLLRLPRFALGLGLSLGRSLPSFGLLASLLLLLRLPCFPLDLSRGLPGFDLLASLRLLRLPRLGLLGPARFRLTLRPLALSLALGLGGLGTLQRCIGLGLFALGLLLALTGLLPCLLLTLEFLAPFAGLPLCLGALFLLAANRLGRLIAARPLCRG